MGNYEKGYGVGSQIALALEDEPTGFARENPIIDGYSREQVAHHAYIMLEAGLIRGEDITNSDSSGLEAIANGLTWQGHEFIDAARDESRWKKAMGTVRDKGGSVTLDVLKQLLVTMMKETLGLN